MTAQLLHCYDYDGNEKIECPKCHWAGTVKELGKECWNDLFDASCPRCDAMLLVVSYPTLEEMERAARRGNKEVKFDLAAIRQVILK